MANICELTPELESEYKSWVATLPEKVQVVANRLKPWCLYRMADTGHRVTIVSFDEGTDDKVYVKVFVSGDFNELCFERQVFGVDPESLEECDLPGKDEKVGARLTDQGEIDDLIEKSRPLIMGYRNKENN